MEENKVVEPVETVLPEEVVDTLPEAEPVEPEKVAEAVAEETTEEVVETPVE